MIEAAAALVGIALLVGLLGIGLGMLVAPRIDRLGSRDDEEEDREP